MSNNEYAIVLSETYIILNRLNKELYLKLPKDLINFIKYNRASEFNYKYDSRKKLIDQDIKQETKALISGIYLNYCASESEKQDLLTICKENEIKHLNEISQKYNLDNLFKNKNTITVINDEIQQESAFMVEYKEKNFLQKIFDKIKHLFKKN